MGVYVVTGGSKGIGNAVVKILRSGGHEAINVDISGGDINADLGTREGRELAISELHRRYQGGLDGLVCNHGIGALPKYKLSYILSVNYFGAIAVMEGLFDLLKKKNGSCAATSSGSISYAKRGRYFVDELLQACGDEDRIGRLVDGYPPPPDKNIQYPLIMYLSSKIALASWVRRASASWAACGVNINAVAPGGVNTTIMQGFAVPDADTYYYPMPALHGKNRIMEPDEVARALTYLVMPEAKGINGMVVFCDAGASAVFDTARYM